MTARARFTQAELTRAIKAARAVDPLAVIRVDPDGGVTILPGVDTPPKPRDDAAPQAWDD